MKKWLGPFLFSILLHSFPNLSFAQHHCGFDEVHQHELTADSTYRQTLKAHENAIRRHVATTDRNFSEVLTIPVVFHVVYADPNAPHNISDAQLQSALQRLNEVFGNADGTSINSNIQFCLATTNPNCEPTNGIVRVDGSVLAEYPTEGIDLEINDSDGIGADRLAVQNLSRWNPEEYLNIWVVNEISNNDGLFGVQAFSSFPGTSLLRDGIVILYNALGYDYDQCSCFQLKYFTHENEIFVHEVGHYLGLYHTFEGDGGGVVCPDTTSTAGDKVADTPAHIRTFSCSTYPNICYPVGHQFDDLEAVSHNYMGYSEQHCQDHFTTG